MINTAGNRWEPSPGYKYITNGTVYTDSIFLGKNDNISHWHDTNDEPLDPQEEATSEDYET